MTFEERVFDAYKELEKARKGRVSQAQLAREVSILSGRVIRQETAGKWIRGKARPEYEELPALAKVLRVSLGWLVWESGERSRLDELAGAQTADLMEKREEPATKKKGKRA